MSFRSTAYRLLGTIAVLLLSGPLAHAGKDCKSANDAPKIERSISVERGADFTAYPWLGEHEGGWAERKGSDTLLCGKLVIHELKADGSVMLTYTHGSSVAWDLSPATYGNLRGEVSGNTLSFSFRGVWLEYVMTFKMTSAGLAGSVAVHKHTQQVGSSVTEPDFTRIGPEIAPPTQTGELPKQ